MCKISKNNNNNNKNKVILEENIHLSKQIMRNL